MSFRVLFILWSIFATVSAAIAQTPTDKWVDYYGQVNLNGEPAVVGSVVAAINEDGLLCGRFIVTTTGVFGFMPVYRDDDFTAERDGALPGEVIYFTVNGRLSSTVPSPVLYPSAFFSQVEVDVIATGEICCFGQSGDVNSDTIEATPVDLSYMVDFLFGGGAAAACGGEGDLNGDAISADPVDLSYFVDYLFSGGAAPVACP